MANDSTLRSDVFNMEDTDTSFSGFLDQSTPVINRRKNNSQLESCSNPSYEEVCYKLQRCQNTNQDLSEHITKLLADKDALEEKVAKLETQNQQLTPKRNKIDVSKACHSTVRIVYRGLVDNKADFAGFFTNDSTRAGFSHPDNQRLTDRIVREVQAVDTISQFSVAEITESCKSYYRSLKDKSTRQRKGTVHLHKSQTKRSRILRTKRERRNMALQRMAWSESTKSEVAKTLTFDYISSEEELVYPPSPFKESGHVRVVRELPWKPALLALRHRQLDRVFWEEIATTKQKTGKTTVLRNSLNSNRPQPMNLSLDTIE